MDWSTLSDKLSGLGDSVGKSLKSVFGSRNERMVRELGPLVDEINQLETWAQELSSEDMKAQTAAWKQAVAAGQVDLDDILPRAFALVRESAVRTLGLRHYDVQLVGGVVLHKGAIAEMMTGEGKTLVATLPLYLNALGGKTVYLITVNDYLARRDAEWMRPVFEYLGLTIGSIQSQMGSAERQDVYSRDIVYGTNNEFGFDYLRDNMKPTVEQQCQKDLAYAIVDEIDSILIDEARTPLIISGPAEFMPDKYAAADKVARELVEDEHFEVKEKEKAVHLLEDGIVRAQEILGVDSFYTHGNTDWPHYIENALRAHKVYEIDREYVVEQGEVVIVDEFTGRKMTGRRWSDGLHQAVETKEGIPIKPESQTLATITFQNYFRLYTKLAGMTGTAITEAGEFLKIYGLDVVSIPTNMPVRREDKVDTVYRTEPEKWNAIVEEIALLKEKGQPVLVGTTTVENSERLSGLLKKAGIQHEVLNAKAGQQEREAHIVAMAGQKGAVTVSTNMAGRGTDIKLGGNFEYRLAAALEEAGLQLGNEDQLEEIDRVRQEVKRQTDADEAEVLALGGLYVLGTERHESRRIDNQLRGRSGRQGNAGESRFFLSLQDPLMRRFYKDWVTNAMEKLGMSEGVPIESPMVGRAIEKAQKKVEDYHFEMRKQLLEYDEVMDEQRKSIYSVRQEVLEDKGLREKVREMFEGVLPRRAQTFVNDAEGFRGWFAASFGFELPLPDAERATDPEFMDSGPALEAVWKRYEEREAELGEEIMRKVDRHLLLHAIDQKWMDHLRAVTALRTGIGLQGYAQRDPKNVYKEEGYKLYEQLLAAVEDDVTALSLRVQVRRPEDGAPPAGGFTQSPEAYQGATPQQPGQPSQQAAAAARALAIARARSQAQRAPASSAFDQARRMEQAREAQARAGEGARETPRPEGASAPKPAAGASPQSPSEVAVVGRNDACPCGSGKKYKKCHGAANG
ncbi:MAG: preprotein translocase subunit SecA [Planctomycetota bacterium]